MAHLENDRFHASHTRHTLVMLASAVLLVMAFLAPQPVSGIRYAFTRDAQVCFLEEISTEDFDITGTYKLDHYPGKSVSLALVLYDPSSSVISSEDMVTGVHTFHLGLGPRLLGAYRLCVEVISPGFNPEEKPPLFIEIDVEQTHAHAAQNKKVLEDTAVREEVDGMQVFAFTDAGGQRKMVLQPRFVLERLERSINQLSATIEEVRDGTDYLVGRENRMRMTSESTFNRVWVCAAITILVTSVCVFFQFRMLKSTIVKKKLI